MRFNIFRKFTTNINPKPKNLSHILDKVISTIALGGLICIICDKSN